MFGKDADALLNEPVTPEGWLINSTGNPTPNRGWDFYFESFDMPGDDIKGFGSSIADCIAQINGIIDEGKS